MVSLANTELLHVVESVAREKSISKDIILDAIAQAICSAESKRYGNGDNIKVDISRKNGEVKIYRAMSVVEEVDDDSTQIDLKRARHIDENAEVGQVIHESLPNFKLSRVSAQAAKKVIVDYIYNVEREKEFEYFKEKEDSILTGKILRIESGNAIVDLGGKAEGFLHRREQIPTENLVVGSQIKLYVKEVRRETKGYQILLSRSDSNMLVKLLALEVPEVNDGIIEVKSVVRDAGSKAKIAVYSKDMSVDVTGCCVGMKGSRIQSVTRELAGEKIDVVLWNPDIAQYVVNALTPANILKVVIDNERHKLEIIVSTDQLSGVLGRRGQNVRLASKLVGWGIDILTDEQESKKRVSEFTKITEIFIQALDVDEVLAQLLVSEGFNSIEQLSIVDSSLLLNIDGFDEEIAQELKNRAISYIENQQSEIMEKLNSLGVSDDLKEFLSMLSHDDILKLAEAGIKNIEDLSEISALEFRKIINRRFNSEQITHILNAAAARTKQE